jgi:hypothetical protein
VKIKHSLSVLPPERQIFYENGKFSQKEQHGCAAIQKNISQYGGNNYQT